MILLLLLTVVWGRFVVGNFHVKVVVDKSFLKVVIIHYCGYGLFSGLQMFLLLRDVMKYFVY